MNGWNQTLGWACIAGLVLAGGLSGCLRKDDKRPSETTDTTGTTDIVGDQNDTTTSATVRIVNYTRAANVTDPVMVAWEVRPMGNASQAFNMTSTAIYWANRSVSNPQTGDDYGNRSEEYTVFGGGNFTTNLTFNQTDTIYLRANAVVNGRDYWSSEISVEIGPSGQLATIQMANAAVGYLSSFTPESVTIKVGDRVQWDNRDNEAHTATATTPSGAFNTGNVAGGAKSREVLFESAGTYEYECSIHPTMTGTITVQAA